MAGRPDPLGGGVEALKTSTADGPLTRIARALPLITVTSWALTLFVPVLDSGNTRGPRIVVSSLGGEPLALVDAQGPFVVAWVLVIGSAASAWVSRSLTGWSVVVMLVAVALTMFLSSMLLDPPRLIWDGVDDQGRPTGGYEVAGPTVGTLIWAAGIAALFAAGVCGLAGRGQQRTGR